MFSVIKKGTLEVYKVYDIQTNSLTKHRYHEEYALIEFLIFANGEWEYVPAENYRPVDS